MATIIWAINAYLILKGCLANNKTPKETLIELRKLVHELKWKLIVNLRRAGAYGPASVPKAHV